MFRLTVGLFFFSGIDAYGQAVANGQIAGAVSDPSARAVPAAAVQLVQKDTG